MLSLIPSAADILIGEMGEGQRHLFRGASETAFPWKESRPKTDLSQVLPGTLGGKQAPQRAWIGKRDMFPWSLVGIHVPRDSQGEI